MKMHSDCHFSSVIAEEFGVAAALILNRMMWSVEDHQANNKKEFFLDGKWWMYDTAVAFKEKFRFFSLSTIKRSLKLLKDADLIESIRPKDQLWDQTNWYTVNEEEYNRRISAFFTMVSPRPYREVLRDTIGGGNLTPSSSSKSHTKNRTKTLSPEEPQREISEKVPEGFEEYQPLMDDLAFLGPEVTLETLMASMAEFYIEKHVMEKITTRLRGHYAGRKERIRRPVECFKSWVLNYLHKTRGIGWEEIVAARNKLRKEEEEALIEF